MNGFRNNDIAQLLIGPLCFQLLFQFVQISDACFVHPSLAIDLTHSNQLDSNMANFETTVEVGKILEFLLVTTEGSICSMSISGFTS